METLNAIPGWAKLAAFPAGAVAILTFKYMIGHELALMIFLTVTIAMVGMVQGMASKRKAVRQANSTPQQTTAWLPTEVPAPIALPVARIADAAQQYVNAQARHYVSVPRNSKNN